MIETDIFDYYNHTNDINEDIEKKNGENLELPIIDLYSYIIIKMYIYWWEKDIIDYWKSLILFYLHYFLYIVNNTKMITA